MGGRYVITGAQLGMFVSIREPAARKKLVEEIEDKQFICDLENEQMKDFDKELQALGEKFGRKEEDEAQH